MNINTLLIAAAALVGIGFGVLIAFIVSKKANQNKANSIVRDAEAEAEVIKKDKMLQAKEKFLQLKAEHEKVISDKNQTILQAENRIKQKEQTISLLPEAFYPFL